MPSYGRRYTSSGARQHRARPGLQRPSRLRPARGTAVQHHGPARTGPGSSPAAKAASAPSALVSTSRAGGPARSCATASGWFPRSQDLPRHRGQVGALGPGRAGHVPGREPPAGVHVDDERFPGPQRPVQLSRDPCAPPRAAAAGPAPTARPPPGRPAGRPDRDVHPHLGQPGGGHRRPAALVVGQHDQGAADRGEPVGLLHQLPARSGPEPGRMPSLVFLGRPHVEPVDRPPRRRLAPPAARPARSAGPRPRRPAPTPRLSLARPVRRPPRARGGPGRAPAPARPASSRWFRCAGPAPGSGRPR